MTGYGLADVQESTTAGGVRLLSAAVPPQDHDHIWRALRADHGRTGWWPVLSWSAREAHRSTFDYPVEAQGTDALRRALALDPVECFAELTRSRWEERLADLEPAQRAEVWAEDYDAQALAGRLTRVTSPPPGRRRETSAYPPGEVLLVPAAAGHEVPVLVPGLIEPANWFGGPGHPDLEPADHLAVLRLWHERHAADLYFANGSRLELSVGRPPVEPVEVAQCAVEQFVYCGDLGQLVGDPIDVARKQVPAGHWSFWWD
ncbi:hypothetical protein Aau02nite_36450 [Amorphoplanes auranticolor]|uniref:DUF4253 domain-containing protein n=1 Tax=Actinoplanes auranticolor TaxID=47988 RepID=A0A919SD89_9ACTN|nr:hypothetical protein Aau02nite_36450 [Actinoplanes auranticolor]